MEDWIRLSDEEEEQVIALLERMIKILDKMLEDCFTIVSQDVLES